MECRAMPNGAAHPDPAALNLYQALHNCQPQARAAGFAGTGFIGTVKPLKNLGQLAGRNSRPGIGHIKRYPASDTIGRCTSRTRIGWYGTYT